MAEGRIRAPIGAAARRQRAPLRLRGASGRFAKDPPQWPESTRRISQLRVTIEYTPTTALRRALGPGRLHVDIVDYPGRVADRPAAAGACPLPNGRAGAVEDARAPQRALSAERLAAIPLHDRCRCPRQRADGAVGRRPLHALSAGRPRSRPGADARRARAASCCRAILPALRCSPSFRCRQQPARSISAARSGRCWRAVSKATRRTWSSRFSATTSPGSTGRSCSSMR